MDLLAPPRDHFPARFWRDDTSFWTAILRCFIALLLFLGIWISWRPLAGVLAIIDFLLRGDAGGDQSHGLHMIWRGILYAFTLGCILTIPVGIWRSTARKLGAKHSLAVSRLAACICAAAVVAALAGVGEFTLQMSRLYDRDINDIRDPKRNSMNAAVSVDRSPDFPLAGFWQGKCGVEVGIAIERESRWLNVYRLEDCGLRGCERARSATTIYKDPDYRVLDPDTIELNARADPRYRSIVHRCG